MMIEKTPTHILYEALKNRDSRYDGHLFFAVTSTGIYCRPICPAPKPKPENVLYFASKDLAQLAGFRACKRCRPEARPGSPAWEGTSTTVKRALRLLADPKGPQSIAELADKLGLSTRHVRRLFIEHLGKPPQDIRTENRLQLAISMLQQSDEPITAIAYASGFQSLRRFNDAFKAQNGIAPRDWRQHYRAETQE